MAHDMTVVFYTANRTRPWFMAHVQSFLRHAIGDLPLISVSQKPLPGFGENICLGDIGQSYLNIYRQVLVGARAVRTPFMAFAEDDILYPPSHFTCFRPPLDAVGYDMHKWKVYTWRMNEFHTDARPMTTTGCIAPTQLVVDALEERFAKYPDEAAIDLSKWAEIGRKEQLLGVTERRVVTFEAPEPHVIFFHDQAIGYQYLGNRKRGGDKRARTIPYWGDIAEVATYYA